MCPNCRGSGRVSDGSGGYKMCGGNMDCPKCDGTGKIEGGLDEQEK